MTDEEEPAKDTAVENAAGCLGLLLLVVIGGIVAFFFDASRPWAPLVIAVAISLCAVVISVLGWNDPPGHGQRRHTLASRMIANLGPHVIVAGGLGLAYSQTRPAGIIGAAGGIALVALGRHLTLIERRWTERVLIGLALTTIVGTAAYLAGPWISSFVPPAEAEDVESGVQRAGIVLGVVGGLGTLALAWWVIASVNDGAPPPPKPPPDPVWEPFPAPVWKPWEPGWWDEHTRFSSAVTDARRFAIADTPPGEALTTGRMLAALARVDLMLDWQRIWLSTGAPEQIGLAAAWDPGGYSGQEWHGLLMSPELAEALSIARQIRDQYSHSDITTGALALGLLAHRNNGATARLLASGRITHGELLRQVQENIVGTTLDGLHRIIPDSPN